MTTMTMTPTLLRSNPAPKPTMTSIAMENIRIALIVNEMRRKELADILGVSYPVASRIWNGRGRLYVHQVFDVAKALDLPPLEFFKEHGQSMFWAYRPQHD